VGSFPRLLTRLRVRGQYRPIVVNVGTHTGRPLEVLAGNHTLQAAMSLGWEQIEATTVDVDDEDAAQIVLADNRLADLGVV
jgi:ParB-like chromosome segregation protein Spo0J